MAVDMFMKIDAVKGESIDAKHGGEIEVLAWSWGMSQSGTMHQGPGGGAGKVSIQDLSFTKYVDSASPHLMKACATGQHYKAATLVVRKAGGTPLEYITIKMAEVLISSVSTGGSGGEDRLTENVTLNFAEVKFNYVPQDAKGGAGTAIPMGYDIASNKPL